MYLQLVMSTGPKLLSKIHIDAWIWRGSTVKKPLHCQFASTCTISTIDLKVILTWYIYIYLYIYIHIYIYIYILCYCINFSGKICLTVPCMYCAIRYVTKLMTTLPAIFCREPFIWLGHWLRTRPIRRLTLIAAQCFLVLCFYLVEDGERWYDIIITLFFFCFCISPLNTYVYIISCYY